jgi:hypothetical protein
MNPHVPLEMVLAGENGAAHLARMGADQVDTFDVLYRRGQVKDVAGPAWVQGHVTVLGVGEEEMRGHLFLI